jgi:ATP-binding cassette subfamily B (MDR/TAP) protein 1
MMLMLLKCKCKCGSQTPGVLQFMLSQGFKRFKYDSCVYIKHANGSPIYLLLYVDDMLIATKSKVEITKLKKLLSSEFDMKDLGAAKKILGMEITRLY